MTRARPRGKPLPTATGVVLLVATLVALAASAGVAWSYPRPGSTERVSVASDGTQGNDLSYSPELSADGRYVAFYSVASNLVPGDTNDSWDVFVHDRELGTTERASVASDGTEGNADSNVPALTPDGRYVAFYSLASNLVPGDTNGSWDVFVHDRELGTTERVSVGPDGTQADGPSRYPALSADGRYVSFSSEASNLVVGDTNGVADVFVHDRESGATERVSVGVGGAEGNSESSLGADLSADGRYVTFTSLAFNLVPADLNATWDIFVHDRELRTTERVSVASDGTQGDDESHRPTISADGRYVAFFSRASTLVPADTNLSADIFVHDRELGTTERVSVASDGAQGEGHSYTPALSPDGRYVAFASQAPLVPEDTNPWYDIFVHDRQLAATDRVSVASDGTQGDNNALEPAIAEGRSVAFVGYASTLVPGDSNSDGDIFVRDRGAPQGVAGELSVLLFPDGVEVSGRATLSGVGLAAANDADADAAVGGIGAELTRAEVALRPEQEDLLFRLQVASLPRVAAGLPGLLYGVEFETAGARYEVRALRAGATPVPPASPYFALYRCDEGCEEQQRLSGSFGTRQDEVLISLPGDAVGGPGTTLAALRAFTALGEAAPGGAVLVDEVNLGDGAIPDTRVELGIAPASAPGDEVEFGTSVAVTAGEFSATLETDALPPGEYRVWARTCVGDVCGPPVASSRIGL